MHDARIRRLLALAILAPALARSAELAPPEYADPSSPAANADQQPFTHRLMDSSAQVYSQVLQHGEGNEAVVVQEGAAHGALVRQAGDGNHVDILQQGAGHLASVTQEGNRNAFSLTQSGQGQRLEVQQWGDGLSAQAAQR